MKNGRFHPDEILLSLTDRCNLRCSHCDIKRGRSSLNAKDAVKFIQSCADFGIRRIGFTGGEPFLVTNLMRRIIKEAVRCRMTFNRIMTNGAWFRTKKELIFTFKSIFYAGYDGDICVSVDAFHCQDLQKVALLIKTAIEIWKRPDIISISAVKGVKEYETSKRLTRLARLLNARIKFNSGKNAFIKKDSLFIKIFCIDLSPVGKAAALKNPWNGKWFKDDFCKGPGNIFFVLPDGKVKPCCGYGNDSDMLTIGSIRTDTPKKLLHNTWKNRFISEVFGSGLHPMRLSIEKSGIRFPGKTQNHCFFCGYLSGGFAQKFSAH
jgi:hypothetical protein